MADIAPIVSLNGEIAPTDSLAGELAMPEKVWMQGPPGPQGQQGEPGAAATVTVGTVTTGEPGTDAIVTNSGTESAAVLNFTIPRGATGAAGAPGPQGPKGDTGETGPAGAGIPDGGTAGQLLGKTETGTAWIDPPQIGASSSDVFITNATPDETYTNAQLDKTTEQIYEAYQSGKYCIACFEGTFYPVTTVETDGTRYMMRCHGFTFSGSNRVRAVILEFTTGDGVTWTLRPRSPELYDVCIRGLQIYGAGGQVYTISVDADGNLTATAAT